MKIIDSHINFWDINNGLNDWVRETNLPKKVLPDDIIEVDTFVHVEAHNEKFNNLCEYNWLKETYPQKNIKVVAFIDFTKDIKIFENDVIKLSNTKDIVGVRQIMSKTDKLSYSPFQKNIPYDLNEKLKILGQTNLVVDLQMYPDQLLPILHLIEESNAKVLLEHFGLPIFENNDSINDWKKMLHEINYLNKFSIKLSGLDILNRVNSFNKIIDIVLEKVDENRLVYGSNYPVSNHNDYHYWYNFLKKALPSKYMNKIFYQNAKKMYAI